MARCEQHGLTYDPAAAAGCVLCRRDATAVTTGGDACAACRRKVDAGLAVCPWCGAAVGAPRSADRYATLRRRAPLYAGAVVALIVATVIFTRLARERCRSTGVAEVEWIADPTTAPRAAARDAIQLDALDAVPHISLARVRTSGNAAYARNMDHGRNHRHDDLRQKMLEVGANAYYNEPSRKIAEDRWEIVSVAVYAHAGPLSAAQRAAYFGAGAACLISGVAADSPAARDGLRTGDLVALVAGTAVAPNNQCAALHTRLDAVDRGSSVSLTVLRGGVETALQLTRPKEGRYGYWYSDVPVQEGPP